MTIRASSPARTDSPLALCATLLMATQLCCSSSKKQDQIPTALSIAVSAGPSAEGAPPRQYLDLGPPQVVPQLATDAQQIALSPDGLLALLGNGLSNTAIQVWDVDRKLLVRELVLPYPMIDAKFGFANDGKTIAAEGPGWGAAWDGSTGALIGSLRPDWPDRVFDFDFDAPTPRAVYWSEEDKAAVLTTLAGDSQARISFPKGAPNSIVLTGNDLTVRFDDNVEVYDLTGKLRPDLAHTADAPTFPATVEFQSTTPIEKALVDPTAAKSLSASAACLHARGRAVCTTYEDPDVRVHLIGSGDTDATTLPRRQPVRLQVDPSAGFTVQCAPKHFSTFGFSQNTSQALVAGQRASAIRAGTSSLPREFENNWFLTKNALVTWTDSQIHLFDAASARFACAIDPASPMGSPIFTVNSDGTRVAVATQLSEGHGAVDLYDATSCNKLSTLDHGHFIRSISFSPDGATVLSTSRYPVGGYYLQDEGASAKLWNVKTGRLLFEAKTHDGAAFSPDGSLFATWWYGELSVITTRLLKKRMGVTGSYLYGMFTPDSKVLVTPLMDTSAAHPGMYEGSGLELWDTTSGRRLQTVGGKSSVLAFSPDSTKVAVARSLSWSIDSNSRSFQLDVIDIQSGKRLVGFNGPAVVEQAEFLGNDLLLVSVGGTIRAIRVSTSTNIALVPVPISPDRCAMITVDDNGNFDFEDPAADKLRARLGDDLRRSDMVPLNKDSPLYRPGLFDSFRQN